MNSSGARLLIPNKSVPIGQQQLSEDLFVIERWAANLRGGYASLTGPGEATSPGDLTQAGGFEVDIPSTDPNGFTVSNNSANFTQFINLDATAQFLVNNSVGGPVRLLGNNLAGAIQLLAGLNGKVTIDGQLGGTTLVQGPVVHITGVELAGSSVVINGAGAPGTEVVGSLQIDNQIGFYGTTPINQRTVIGSRGGNAALASLLSQLAAYGLIVDGTTP